nr:response regulator [Rummeliibacillus suwonensis]
MDVKIRSSGSVKKILIVDDQQGIRLLLNEIFKNEGYETFLASNGIEAVQYVDNNVIDCALLDMKIPGMNGLEILKHIKSLFKELPVVMMTGNGDTDLIHRAKELGANHFFTKPFDIFEVKDTINKLIQE